jgi:hypothetical protein
MYMLQLRSWVLYARHSQPVAIPMVGDYISTHFILLFALSFSATGMESSILVYNLWVCACGGQ